MDLSPDTIADEALGEAEVLTGTIDPETEPYKSKYKAAEVLSSAVSKIKESGSNSEAMPTEELVALLEITRGTILLETDMLSAGQTAIETHLQVLEDKVQKNPNASGDSVLLAKAYNALGGLFYGRSLYQDSIDMLSKAETLQSSHKGYENDSMAQDVHTQTVFYLAQAYAAAGQSDRAALYCAQTMSRQVSTGKYQLRDWVTNALRISVYFVDHMNYGVAEYCLRAADALVLEDSSGSGLSDEDHAMIHKAWGNIYMERLVTSFRKHVDGQDIHAQEDTGSTVRHIEFKGLDIPGPDLLLEGEAALARDFPSARDLFNKALPRFKKALDVYLLDGWVTEHVNLLLDICNLYRCLAGFEPDAHRRCVMHKQRIKQLEPVMEVLNQEFYLGLVRSINLEAAFAYRDIMEIKDKGGRESDKVAVAGQAASKYFQRFITTYEVDGKLPDKISEESENLLLTSCLNLGRVLHRTAPVAASDKAIQAAVLSSRHLQWAADYIKRHNLEGMQEEAKLALDLADLLEEKLRLMLRTGVAA